MKCNLCGHDNPPGRTNCVNCRFPLGGVEDIVTVGKGDTPSPDQTIPSAKSAEHPSPPPPNMDGPAQTIPSGGGAPAESAQRRDAEQVVGFDWQPGDVILDLYEVRPVTEGYGEDAEEKPYHEGGFGRVYRVWHRSWQIEMAVKSPRADAFQSQGQKDAFIRECETWINLGLHPNVAACHYVRELGGAPRVFSDYAQAGTLAGWIRSRRLYEGGHQQALARILDCAIQMAWGLHYAHERGVIHQDVKPLNALMENDGTLKVTDFGLANAIAKAGVDALGGVAGGSVMVSSGGMTPAYCSPEQQAGEKLDRRTDVWSWAVSVLEMFTGGVTWQSGTLAGHVLSSMLEDGALDDTLPELPAQVSDLLRHCFKDRSEDRPRTLGDCATTLIEVYAEIAGEAYPREEPKKVGDTADALNNRALSYIDLGFAAEAIEMWTKAIQLSPLHFESVYNQAIILWSNGQISDTDVVNRLSALSVKDSGSWRISYYLGLVHMSRFDGAAAVRYFREAEKLGAANIQNHLKLATQPDQNICCIKSIKNTFRWSGRDWIAKLRLSADGRKAITCGSREKFAQLWDIEEGRRLKTLKGHSDTVRMVDISAEGELAISVCHNHTAVWRQLFTKHSVTRWRTSGASSVALAKNRKWAAVGGSSNLYYIDLAHGKALRTLCGIKRKIGYLCGTPDGNGLICVGDTGTISIWDVARERLRSVLETGEQGLISADISRDGEYFLIVGGGTLQRGNRISVWSINEAKIIVTMHNIFDGVESARFIGDGSFIISSGGSIRLWSVLSGQCIRTIQAHGAYAPAIDVSKNGRLAVSGGWDKMIRVWAMPQIKSPSLPRILSGVHRIENVSKEQALIDGYITSAKSALISGDVYVALAYLRRARSRDHSDRGSEIMDLWHQAGRSCTRKVLESLQCAGTLNGHACGVEDVYISRDARLIVSIGENECPFVWDRSSQQLLTKCVSHEYPALGMRALAVNERDGLIAAASEVGWILLWDLRTGEKAGSAIEVEGDVNSLCIMEKSGLLLSGMGGSASGFLQQLPAEIWDTRKRTRVNTISFKNDYATAVCVSSDGCYALLGTESGILFLWSISESKYIRVFKGHSKEITCVQFSEDGQQALSASRDKTMRVWSMRSGECEVVCKSRYPITSACYAGTAEWALSASGNTLTVWDIKVGSPTHNIEGHTAPINALCVDPSGRWVITGSNDYTVKIWDLCWDYEVQDGGNEISNLV
jgi:WD40 repeat protein/serine/threonine protein kinase